MSEEKQQLDIVQISVIVYSYMDTAKIFKRLKWVVNFAG